MNLSITHKPHIRNILLLILTIGLPLSVAFVFARDLKQIEEIVRSAGLFGPVISIFLFVLFGFTPLPAEPLAVINGIVFGPLEGSILNLIGNSAASFIEYYVGTRMGSAGHFESPMSKLPKSLQRFSPNSLWFLIGFRFIPQIGGKIVSFGAGILHVPIRRYLWTSILANAVGSLLLAFTGFGILHL